LGHLRREGEHAPEPRTKFAAKIDLLIEAGDESEAEEAVNAAVDAASGVGGVRMATWKGPVTRL